MLSPLESVELAKAVLALNEVDAKRRLLTLLLLNDNEAERLLAEWAQTPENVERSLRDSLAQIVGELHDSIERDEFTNYWEEDKLTNEWSYVRDMAAQVSKAAGTVPLEALLNLAFETQDELNEQTDFDWHPDPVEALSDLLEAAVVGTISANPARKDDILKRYDAFLKQKENVSESWRTELVKEAQTAWAQEKASAERT